MTGKKFGNGWEKNLEMTGEKIWKWLGKKFGNDWEKNLEMTAVNAIATPLAAFATCPLGIFYCGPYMFVTRGSNSP